MKLAASKNLGVGAVGPKLRGAARRRVPSDEVRIQAGFVESSFHTFEEMQLVERRRAFCRNVDEWKVGSTRLPRDVSEGASSPGLAGRQQEPRFG